MEEIENIEENEDSISKQKKTALMQNYTVGRTSTNVYNFTNPQAELD